MAPFGCRRSMLQLVALQVVFGVVYLINANYSVVRGPSKHQVSADGSLPAGRVSDTWTIADRYTNYTIGRLNLKQSTGEPVVPGQVINDVSSFEYSINTERLCLEWNESSARTLLVMVVSAGGNFEKREMIRTTWARNLIDSAHLGHRWARYSFLIGSASPAVQRSIDEEHHLRDDIIQLKLPDDYANLSQKSVALLHWVEQFCPQAQLVLKCDDDIFVNARSLASLIKAIDGSSSLYGNGMAGDQPKRQPDNKYFVSRQVWPWSTYPPYLFGGAYLIGRRAARHLLAAARTTPYFVFEDVYLTGLCAIKADVGLLVSKRMYERIFPSKLTPCFIRNTAMWQTQTLDQFVTSQRQVEFVYTREVRCTKLCDYLQIC